MSDLKKKLIRLAYQKPHLRDDLLPLIQKQAARFDFSKSFNANNEAWRRRLIDLRKDLKRAGEANGHEFWGLHISRSRYDITKIAFDTTLVLSESWKGTDRELIDFLKRTYGFDELELDETYTNTYHLSAHLLPSPIEEGVSSL